ncbi:hypothetical protein J3A64_004815 [Pseudarthrobacter sp. PvP004]|uniref:hypothetical protein n=1 Tax=Pseudarthrobacter sp. PvP004 TaxID=2817850 RepID=UPI001AE6A8D7|nr:hypothetical protein [Pseudarthrobacter sp. PvP004]MBP2269275.1 hypothetical protein [Pseudarthrobacter sp. PvP004]
MSGTPDGKEVPASGEERLQAEEPQQAPEADPLLRPEMPLGPDADDDPSAPDAEDMHRRGPDDSPLG